MMMMRHYLIKGHGGGDFNGHDDDINEANEVDDDDDDDDEVSPDKGTWWLSGRTFDQQFALCRELRSGRPDRQHGHHHEEGGGGG